MGLSSEHAPFFNKLVLHFHPFLLAMINIYLTIGVSGSFYNDYYVEICSTHQSKPKDFYKLEEENINSDVLDPVLDLCPYPLWISFGV